MGSALGLAALHGSPEPGRAGGSSEFKVLTQHHQVINRQRDGFRAFQGEWVWQHGGMHMRVGRWGPGCPDWGSGWVWMGRGGRGRCGLPGRGGVL
jgi:hypothetical protein